MNDYWNNPPEPQEDATIEEVMFLLEESGVDRKLLDKYKKYLYKLASEAEKECPFCVENLEHSLSEDDIIKSFMRNP